ncbi:MAG TPA: caspase domain-containing protein, partial [Terriglobales bacterium]|nr:caspase domain-containing protein [Terriglobales bacterium]
MTAFIKLTLFILVTVVTTATAAGAAKRVALVIGNSAYRHAGELANPRNDATDIAAALRKADFQVLDALDVDKAAFDRKIRDFASALSDAEAGVLFYAGHGLQVAGKNYLVPIDAELTTADALEFEMVQLDTIHRIMERQSTTNILFIDACRNNPLARNLSRAMGTRSTEIGRGLAPVDSGVGSLISFSTQPGNVALDGSGRNSPYAAALIRRISTSNDDLSALLIDVRNDVRRDTANKQIPWEHSALTGRFHFNGQKIPAAPSAPTAPAGSEAAQVWSTIK